MSPPTNMHDDPFRDSDNAIDENVPASISQRHDLSTGYLLGCNEAQLSLQDKLVVHKSSSSSDSSSGCCGIGVAQKYNRPKDFSIPYYTVLWVVLPNTDTLHITYARPTASSYGKPAAVAPATLTFTLTKAAQQSAALFVSNLLSRAYPKGTVRQKSIKVLINPFGGQGHASRIYTSSIEPLFKASFCTVSAEATRYSGHARDIATALDVGAFDVIACCSGDGLPYEVFNGLGAKPDARRALASIAVVQLPCGSGNAMSANCLGTVSPSLAALAVVKGVPVPIDLASVTQGGTRVLSFLSQSVGLLAEADLDTEHLRWMGDARFTWGVLVRLLRKTVYPCDVAMDVVDGDKASIRARWEWAQETTPAHTRKQPSSNQTVSENEDGPGAHLQAAEPPSTRYDPSNPLTASLALPPLRFGTSTSPLPSNWKTTSYPTLGTLFVGNVPLASATVRLCPFALPSDGCVDLAIVRGDIARIDAIKAMNAAEDGKAGSFAEVECVEYEKVSAFRVTPRHADCVDTKGSIAVDGERFPFRTFQVEVHRGLGTVLVRPGLQAGAAQG